MLVDFRIQDLTIRLSLYLKIDHPSDRSQVVLALPHVASLATAFLHSIDVTLFDWSFSKKKDAATTSPYLIDHSSVEDRSIENLRYFLVIRKATSTSVCSPTR